MIVWRIYTEDKNTRRIVDTCKQVFPNQGITFFHTRGIWQGVEEHSFVIEVIGTPSDETIIVNLAKTIKTDNFQQAVLVTAHELLDYHIV